MGDANDNNHCFFEACEMKFMVISIEFAPRNETLQWAAGVVNQHPDHRVILATHCYMGQESRDTVYGASLDINANSGEEIWQKFVRKHPNIFLVVSGHIGGVGFQASTNDAGGKVFEMLANYQLLPHGGDGWLRSLRFVPSENKIPRPDLFAGTGQVQQRRSRGLFTRLRNAGFPDRVIAHDSKNGWFDWARER